MGRQATGTVDFHGTPPRWWARVTVTDKATGKKHRPWVDLERPDLRNTPADKAIAQRLARQRAKLAAKRAFLGPAVAAGSKLTLADLEEKWHSLLERNPDLAAKTVARYKQSWGHLRETFAKVAIGDLTPVRIREWIWKRRGERGVSTVLNDCNALSRFFQDAIGEKWIPGPNPMRDAIVVDAKPKQSHPESEDIVRLTQDHLEALLGAAEMPHDVFGLLLVDATSGARDGELRGLQFKHLRDPRDGRLCLNIVQQAIETDEGVVLGPPKWGSKRMVPQHPQAAPWLAWWRETGWAKQVGRAPTDEDFVFPDAEGNIARPQDAKLVQRWATRAHVPTTFTRADGTTDNIDMQAVRRTFASLLGELEVEGEVIDKLLGHKAKSVRGRHYMAITFERMQRAVERLVLDLPARGGVPARPVESSFESSNGPDPANDGGSGTTLQATGTSGNSDSRRRLARWRGPRSSKPV